MLTLHRREEGATIDQVMGRASLTVRGLFAGLKKKGIDVRAKEKAKQASPGKEGAKGSYSVSHALATAMTTRGLASRLLWRGAGSLARRRWRLGWIRLPGGRTRWRG